MNFVYVVETMGRYKIGYTKNVEHRIKELSSATPFETVLIHSFECEIEKGKEAESFLHRIFKSKRIHGEWFLLTLLDVAFIRSIIYYRNDTFIYESVGAPVPDSGDERESKLFEYTSDDSVTEYITEIDIQNFLRGAWRRQNSKKHPFSRRHWCERRRPRMPRVQYSAVMRILKEHNLIINRQIGASGYLTVPPVRAMEIITSNSDNQERDI